MEKEEVVEQLESESNDSSLEKEKDDSKEQSHCQVSEKKASTNSKDECCCQGKKGKCHQGKKDKEHQLKEEIKRLEDFNQQLVEKVKLAQAELINYRHRKDEETNSLLKYANQDLIMELIPIVDNFERAIQLDDNDLTDELSQFLAGFKMMYATLTDVLKKFGVSEIDCVGKVFNPSEEQALMTDCIPEMDDDVVTEVLLKGYKLKDRVIRPASVKVNQK